MNKLAAEVIGEGFAGVRPRKIGKVKLQAFTLHPSALVAAVTLSLRAATRFTLEQLAIDADREGLGWTQAGTIADRTPRSAKIRLTVDRAGHVAQTDRYSVVSIRRAFRELGELGILLTGQGMGVGTWRRVPPFGRFPTPTRGRLRGVLGRATSHGGIVWRLNLELLEAVRREGGGALARKVEDRSRHDRSSELRSPSSKERSEPARRPEPGEDARSGPDGPSEAAPSAPQLLTGPTGRERAAGETPSQTVAASSSAAALDGRRAIPDKTLQGEQGQPAGQLVAPADVSRFVASLFGKRGKACKTTK